MDVIEIQQWQGSKLLKTRTLGEVRTEIGARLHELKDADDPTHSLYGHLDYLSLGGLTEGHLPWPSSWSWIACFVVTGGSEGHYLHVEVITNDQRWLLYLGKTFSGIDKALEISNALTKMLGA